MLDRVDFVRESIEFLHDFIIKSIQKHAENYGVTAPQLRVIFEVWVNKPISIKQLTERLRMTQSTVSDIVDRLTAKGILMKTPNPNDKRSVDITVTDTFLEQVNKGDLEPLNKLLREALQQLQPEEQEAVEKGMRILVTAAKEKMESEGMDTLDSFDVLFVPKGNREK
ncbi:MarR family transcriptional regulator [Gracilibacillus sp. S3-1-1]|uniref:MarR family transcriptional regulator n=1 Tax=Gracilibacillus pellucidus TaxID=3095368 RepID=A0ACC6M0N6_9BACI|nr:MarR family transcriptional regulator [Gracilibacillus sp. S3-1-1]MDX8044447.1 MarR family transcriptional regulator [Gracilibacillus sp. S3-1-1]